MASLHDNRDALPRSDERGEFPDQTWSCIRDALRGMRYGQVTVIVQDGVIVQIDRTERRRFQRNNSSS